MVISDLDEDLDKLVKFLWFIKIKSPLYSLSEMEISSLITDEQLLLHSFSDNERKFAKNLIDKAKLFRSKEAEFLEIVSNVSFFLILIRLSF